MFKSLVFGALLGVAAAAGNNAPIPNAATAVQDEVSLKSIKSSDGAANTLFTIQSRSSVFDPATSRLHLKNVMPVVLFTQGDTTGRLHAADFYAHVKGAADVLVEGDRNGTVDRAVYRISDPKYDNLTNSVDFKAAARGVKDAPILKGGMVGAAIAGPDAEKGLVKPVAANEAGRPQSLVNTVVFVDAKAAEVGGKKGGKCEAWGCALGGDK